MGPNDDITHFEYSKKHNRISGPEVVGLELANSNDIEGLLKRMSDRNFLGEYLNDNPDLLNMII